MNIRCRFAAIAGFAAATGSTATMPLKYLLRDIYEFYAF
jgi:hypothetical protein